MNVTMNRSIATGLIIIVIASSSLISCYYDSEEELYPVTGQGCDTINVTFTKNISPILGTYCMGCHSNANAPGSGNNIRLETYDDARANSARMYTAVAHLGPNPMPKNAGKLSDCVIRQFAIWNTTNTPF
jgi:hypothetical protein